MIARDLISDTVPSLKTSDPASRVLEWMSEFKVGHLPVVNNEELLGMVAEDDLLDLEDPSHPIGNVRLSLPETAYVYEDAHIFDVVRTTAQLKLDVLPVLRSRDNHYLGVLSKTDIIEAVSDLLNAGEPGGIIILEVAQNSYHLSEIARICENNDAKILSLSITNAPNPVRLWVTIKLNIRELSRVIATFERFEYTIVRVIFDAEQMQDYQEQYENLIRFLNL